MDHLITMQRQYEQRIKELEAQGVCPMDAPLLAIIQLQGETNVTTTRIDNKPENRSSHTTRQGISDRSCDCVTSVRRIRKIIQAGLPTEKLLRETWLMATTPEGLVKKKVIALLKQYGCYYFYPMTHGYGKSGVADIVVCYRGQFIAIECKADATKKMTALQIKNAQDVWKAGGVSMLIHKDNIHILEEILNEKM